MAKRKTPKADKIVDLKPKPENISEEHLGIVQNTINSIKVIIYVYILVIQRPNKLRCIL